MYSFKVNNAFYIPITFMANDEPGVFTLKHKHTRSYKHNQNIALKCWYCFIKALYYGYAETRIALYYDNLPPESSPNVWEFG